ncbi:hypothetical protein CoNPh35_CDS0069 [Staphylococcus phage S-CoN_Ph35]|nr:hypothetical protein CoNPh35_CDS0069 [Staphylococcus phage S-CoN_Ph35]
MFRFNLLLYILLGTKLILCDYTIIFFRFKFINFKIK